MLQSHELDQCSELCISLTMKPDDARNLDPTPYQADYMGHKFQMDRNEKLSMFG
ncbi:Hypothetical protein SMAX5B_015048, partial [Scophthalmus maximus]